MAEALTWLADVLRDQQLRVVDDGAWRGRSAPGAFGPIKGVICHHTACGQPGNMPSFTLLRKGRSDLSGPLAQLGLGRDGTFYLIADGRANHAGEGSWQGISSGNTCFIGIEAENDGIGEAWSDAQLGAYRHGVAAILRRIGVNATMCCAHREYAPKRKIDPKGIDMDAFRRTVQAILDSGDKAELVAAKDAAGRLTLSRGMSGANVTRLQTVLGQQADGLFGGHTEAAVRGFQRANGLDADGIVGPLTWAALPAPAA